MAGCRPGWGVERQHCAGASGTCGVKQPAPYSGGGCSPLAALGPLLGHGHRKSADGLRLCWQRGGAILPLALSDALQALPCRAWAWHPLEISCVDILTLAPVWDHCPQPGQCCCQSCCLPFSSCSQCCCHSCPMICQHVPGIIGQLLFSLKLSKAVLCWSWAGVCRQLLHGAG